MRTITIPRVRKMCIVAALLPLALLSISRAAAQPNATRAGDETIAIMGANVIAMKAGDEVLPRRTVLVRNGRIVAIGLVGQVDVPAGARRIEAEGQYLMPGLADMHVHLEYGTDPGILTRFLAYGVTTVRGMDGRPYIVQWREQVARGALPGPTIITAGPILDGDPPLRDDNQRIADAAAARAAVREQAAAGYDFIKVYNNLGAEPYRAILAAAGEAGLPVAGHVPRAVGLGGALNAGQRQFEHLADLGASIESDASPFRGRWHWSRLYLAPPADSARMDSVAREMARAGAWTTPTMIERERSLAPTDSLERWIVAQEMAGIPAFWRDAWRGQVERSAARMDADDWTLIGQGRANRERMLRGLHRAGAGLLIGTDTPNPFVVPGFAVHQEIALWVRAGIPPHAALAAATREAARASGGLAEWGTVEVGKRADLLLLAANPLDDVGALHRPVGIMVRGRWHSAEQMESWRR